MSAEMADLRERLYRASDSLLNLAESKRTRESEARLMAKRSGVQLAISFVEEVLRADRLGAGPGLEATQYPSLLSTETGGGEYGASPPPRAESP